jgi:hypothetical protein
MVNHQPLTKNENLQIEYNKGVQLDVFLVKVDKIARSDDTVHGGADLVLAKCKHLETVKKRCDEHMQHVEGLLNLEKKQNEKTSGKKVGASARKPNATGNNN